MSFARIASSAYQKWPFYISEHCHRFLRRAHRVHPTTRLQGFRKTGDEKWTHLRCVCMYLLLWSTGSDHMRLALTWSTPVLSVPSFFFPHQLVKRPVYVRCWNCLCSMLDLCGGGVFKPLFAAKTRKRAAQQENASSIGGRMWSLLRYRVPGKIWGIHLEDERYHHREPSFRRQFFDKWASLKFFWRTQRRYQGDRHPFTPSDVADKMHDTKLTAHEGLRGDIKVTDIPLLLLMLQTRCTTRSWQRFWMMELD